MDGIGQRIQIFKHDKLAKIASIDYSYKERPRLSLEYGCYLCAHFLFLVEYSSDGRLFEGQQAIFRLKESGHRCCPPGEPIFYGDIVLWPEKLTIMFERERGMSEETLVDFLRRTFAYEQFKPEGEQIVRADPMIVFGGEKLGRLGKIITSDLGLRL